MSRRRRRSFDDLRVLIPYCRQSMARPGETSQTSLSLDAQEDAIRTYGQLHGYTVEAAIRDHDLKGETSERAGVVEMLERARPGVTIGVHLWDRLGRGFVLDAIAEQIEMRGARAISITQSSDRFGRRIHAVLGAQYVDELSDRLAAVAIRRVQRGQHIGYMPYGYDRPGRVTYTDKHDIEHVRHTGPLEIVPDQADVVRLIFARRVAGDSFSMIARSLNASGVRAFRGGQWSTSSLRKIVANPIYAGAARCGDVVNWDARHEPIVSRDEWDKAQAVAGLLPPTRLKDKTSFIDGLVYHSCGSRMYIGNTKTGGRMYSYVRCGRSVMVGDSECRAPRGTVSITFMERAVRLCLAHDLSDVLPWTEAVERAATKAGATDTARQRHQLTERLAKLERERTRARSLWIAGIDSLETFQEYNAEFNRVVATIERELAELPALPDAQLIRQTAAQLAEMNDVMSYVSDAALRQGLMTLGRIIVSEPGVRIDYAAPFRDLIRTPHTINPKTGRLVL